MALLAAVKVQPTTMKLKLDAQPVRCRDRKVPLPSQEQVKNI